MPSEKSSPRQENKPPVRDLSILTGAPRLGPRPSAATPTATPDPEPAATAPPTGGQRSTAPVTETASQARPPAPPARRPRRATPTSAAADQYLTSRRSIVATAETAERVRRLRKTSQMSSTQIVLAAVKDCHDQLEQLVQEDLASQGIVPGELWDEVAPARPRRSSPTVQIQFQPTLQQLAVLDRLVEQTGARDRSHLLELALRTYLDRHDNA